jgi:hypothetical protein
MLELNTLSVPLDRVDAQPHRQMKNVIGLVGGFLTPPIQKNPSEAALDFLSANVELAGDLFASGKGGPSTPGPAIAHQVGSPAGYHVAIQQTHQGYPLYGGTAIVHMTEERRVHFFTSDLAQDIPDIDPEDVQQKGASRDDALDIVGKQLPWRERGERAKTEIGIVRRNDDWRMAWRVNVTLSPADEIHEQDDRSGDWLAFVDVQTGDLLDLLNVTVYATGEGRVFYPNPPVALRQDNMTAATAIPPQAYRSIELSRLDASGYLRGRYVDTGHTENRVRDPQHTYNYDRSNPGFEEVMAYYCVDEVMDWLRRLGWKDLFSQPLNVNAHTAWGDEAKFLPHRWAIYLGKGGIDDAEDASIILHELGHAIQDAQVKGWANCRQHLPVRAMGEGFADFLSAVYFAEERRGFHTGWVGDWDALGYHHPAPYLRRVIEDKTVDAWVGDEHKDGEIWSAALWDLFLAMGGDSSNANTRKKARSMVVKLALQSHHYLSDGDRGSLKFEDGVKALLTANQFLSSDQTTPGLHHERIQEIFAKRGIQSS